MQIIDLHIILSNSSNERSKTTVLFMRKQQGIYEKTIVVELH